MFPWYLIFLKTSLVFPILLFSSISLHWLSRKAFLSSLAILWNSAFKWVYLSFSLLPFTSLLFKAICKAPQIANLLFCIYFSWGWSCSPSPVQCHEPLSIAHQTLCLSSPSPPAFSLSQYQGLFKRVISLLHHVAKELEFQLQHQSFQWIFRTDFL